MPAEVGRLAEIWHSGWHEAHARLMPPELTRLRTLESFLPRLETALAQVRVVGPPGAAVGLCIVKGDELYQLFVDAAARGTGVAAALLTDAEDRIQRAGFATAWLACAIGNDRAARFYEKSGWSRTGTVVYQSETAQRTIPVAVWRYEKALIAIG